MIGKSISMDRIMDPNSRKMVIVPMDHGVTIGPLPGLVDVRQTINSVTSGGANAIVIHKGLVKAAHGKNGKNIGLILHLSASTQMAPDPTSKTTVWAPVEEAIKLGADAVSVHGNLGSEDEKSMLNDLGSVAKAAMEWGMPLLAMMYTRGPKAENEYGVKLVKHAARVGSELGADIVKVVYTGSPEGFKEVVDRFFGS